MYPHKLKGGLDPSELPMAMTIAAFSAIALTNGLELNIRIWMTFKKHGGLYFWSLNFATLGIILHALAFVWRFFQVVKDDMITVVVMNVGWWFMVTGHSLVLYSRLHLAVTDYLRYKWVLYLIIANAILFHLPTSILNLGANTTMAETFLLTANVMEKVQITVFSIQEFIISYIYVTAARKTLKPDDLFSKPCLRRALKHLINVHLVIVLMNLALMVTAYADYYDVEETMKPALYAVKLRLEFSVFSQLMVLNRSDELKMYYRSAGSAMGIAHITTSGHHSAGGELHSVAVSYTADAAIGNTSRTHHDIPGIWATGEIIQATKEVPEHSLDYDRASMDFYEQSRMDSVAMPHAAMPPVVVRRPGQWYGNGAPSESEIELVGLGVSSHYNGGGRAFR